jgi:hypothetical protein
VGNPGEGGNNGSPKTVAASSDINQSSISGDTSKSGAVKTIASPKILTKSSPVNELLRRNNLKLTVDTAGARGALSKYVMNPSISGAAKQQSPDHRMADENSPVEEDKTNMIPIANFKSNKLSQIDRKQR